MKKVKKSLVLAAAAICLNMLGAWTSAPAEDSDRYADVLSYSTYSYELLSYESRDLDYRENPTPIYSANTGMSNACGPVAGAEIVGYYDKYYENMIGGWQSYYPSNGRYKSQDGVYVPALIDDLYDKMRTNVVDMGVSAEEFRDGLTQYVNGRGYDISLQNVLSGSDIDYEACKTAIKNDKMMVLLSNGTNVYTITEGDCTHTITAYAITGNHIMTVTGYREIKYRKYGMIFRTDKYLRVSTGLPSPKTAYYKVNPHNLNFAYIVNIA